MNLKHAVRTYFLVAIGVFAGSVYGELDHSEDDERGVAATHERSTSRSWVVVHAAVRSLAWPVLALTRSKSVEYRLISAPLAVAAKAMRRFV